MTMTLEEARQRVRLRLEDTGPTPLWSDDEIRAGIADSLAHYAHHFPDEEIEEIPVVAGAVEITLPDPTRRVRRVIDPRGAVVPPRGLPLRGTDAVEQGWEIWSGKIRFARPLIEGTYAIWFTIGRTLPESELEPLPIVTGDELLLVNGALVWCLEQRSVAEWKRGPLPARYETILRRARVEHDRAWKTRLRSVRTGRLQSTT